MRYIILFLFLSKIIVAQDAAIPILDELDKTMLKSQQYDEEKENRIRGLQSLLSYEKGDLAEAERYNINNKLIEEYWSYSFDSTIAYFNRNMRIATEQNNEEWMNETKLGLAMLLASSGRYKESQSILETIDRSNLPPLLIKDYYNCYRKIYSDLDYFAIYHTYREDYADIYKAYSDSVAPLLQKEEDEYLYLQEWELLDQGRFEECLRINSLRLSNNKIATKEYSYITFQRSMVYEQMDDREMEQKYLALSAISDIMASRKDNASLAKLALRAYEEGDIERASRYIKYSFKDAIAYNSKLRFVEIANSFSLIMESHELETAKKNRALLTFTVIVSFLSLIFLALLYYVYNINRNLQKAKSEIYEINEQYKVANTSLEETMLELKMSYQDLAEANKIKELYIGNFMKSCSEFIDKLNENRLLVNKMLRERKYQQLFDMTKKVNTIKEETEAFYIIFDKTFLTLYPTFVDELNELLLDNEKIKLENSKILNTELRILALLRLGIKDSSRIAQFLRYSVNTIYNYRAKIKSKAKGSREDFENQVLQIGAYKKF